MFFIIEILDNIPSKKKKSQFFFKKLTEFMQKKTLLGSFYLDCTVKREGGGGRAWVWSNTHHARVFFLNFAKPSTLCPNGQPQILSPHKPFFSFVCCGSFWFG
jgi:hypothetical protein